MKSVSFILTAAIVAIVIAACGSATSSSTSKNRTTTTTRPALHTSAGRQRLEMQAQQLISRVASASGRLASSNSASAQQARAQLETLHSELDAFSSRASTRFAHNDPLRPIIVQSTRRAARAAQALSELTLSGQTRKTLRNARSEISNLSSSVRLLRSGITSAAAQKATTGVQALGQLLGVGSS